MPPGKKNCAGASNAGGAPPLEWPLRSKVFWSKPEQDAMIKRAVEIQKENPELSGLPLLRQAMLVLPVDRRRKIKSFSRVEWFEPALRAEVKRRSEAATVTQAIVIAPHEADPYVPILKLSAGELERQSKMAEDWMKKNAEQGETMISLLGTLCRELQSLNHKLSQPVPMTKPLPPKNGKHFRKPSDN